jgi:hypothetical protein
MATGLTPSATSDNTALAHYPVGRRTIVGCQEKRKPTLAYAKELVHESGYVDWLITTLLANIARH